MLDRRTLLRAGAMLPAAFAASDAQRREPPLRERAQRAGLLFGAAAAWPALRNDAEYAERFAEECGILVPENVLEMQIVHPEPDRFDFEPGDFMAAFAMKNGMKMRGHTLVWHQQVGSWVPGAANRDNAAGIFRDHIRTVASHYRGRMHYWDVVNEAILPKDGLENGLRKTPWLDLLGPGYIATAFREAHQADPEALLCYNDCGMDYATPDDDARRAAVLDLLRRLKKDGVPVHGFDMQAHLNAGRRKDIDGPTLRRFLGQVADLGLKILVTELDVADRDLPDDTSERDAGVAQVYAEYLGAVLEEKAVIAVLTWGLDRQVHLARAHEPPPDGAPARVLPLAAGYGRKPAWHAMAKAFDARKI